jgi:hypothetical protein
MHDTKQRGSMKKNYLLHLIIILTLFSGCHTMPMVEDARAIEQGQLEVIMRASFTKESFTADLPGIWGNYEKSDIATDNVRAGWSLRYGILDGLEGGIHLELMNAITGIDMKLQR